MRVKGKVAGDTVVLEEVLPQGSSVEVVTSEAAEDGVSVDEATEEELYRAMTEADTEEGISVEEAFARLPPKQRTA